jgi:DNA adenine methylase
MHYLGSKARHAKEITAITLANRRADQIYVEPFVGGGNIIVQVPQGAGRIANDKNFAMVALLDHLGNKGWLPPETMSQAEWRKLMKDKDRVADLSPEGQALFAFAATGPTFGSMWAGQWAKDDADKAPGTRYRQAREAAIRDQPGLAGIEFHHGSFADLVIPDGALVYCDPPYSGTTGYAGATTKIKVGEDTNKNMWKAGAFWKWADALVDRGCSVFVSEYKGPDSSAFNIPATPEQKAALEAARAAYKALDPNDAGIPSHIFEEAGARIRAAEASISANARARCDAWKLLWEKEVAVNINGGNVDKTNNETAKTEKERLFHRAP